MSINLYFWSLPVLHAIGSFAFLWTCSGCNLKFLVWCHLTTIFTFAPESCYRKQINVLKTVDGTESSVWTRHYPSSTQASPAQIEGVSVYSPCLFGKGIVVHARQTCRQQTSHLLKQTLSETIKPIANSCMLSSNPSINPVVCWYYFLMLVLIIV